MDENKQMQEVLKKIEENSRKTARNSTLQTIFTLVAALCCVVVVIAVLSVMPRVDGLLTQVETVLVNLEQVSGELGKLDLEGMIANVDELVTSGQVSLEQTMEKLETIDFETLNQAIKDLAKVIEPLARLFGR